MSVTKADLIAFEEEVARRYENGEIRGPVHLRNGNEDCLMQIFEKVDDYDTIFATWANHLEALLHGIPADRIMKRILESESMAMNFPDYNFYTSAIVGGILPIAVGVAWQKKFYPVDPNDNTRVWCFIGDMAAQTGIAHECFSYSLAHDLPISFVVADNKKSVCTPTDEVWGENSAFRLIERYSIALHKQYKAKNVEFYYYSYECGYPHSGTGTFVEF